MNTASIEVGAVTDDRLATAPSSAAAANTLVRRDGSGNFSAGVITAGRLALPLDPFDPTPVTFATTGTDAFIRAGGGSVFLGPSAGAAAGGDAWDNAAFGWGALRSVTSGLANTAVGHAAGANITSGGGNVAVGWLSLHDAAGNSVDNVAVGISALRFVTGSFNIGIGRLAGNAVGVGSHNIYVGHGGAAESNTIRIGGGNQSRTFVAGIRGVTTGVTDAVSVMIDGNGQLGTVSSSGRFKHDVTPLGDFTSRLHALRPVSFRYLPSLDSSQTLTYGLIAEEVAEVLPDLVVRNAKGEIETVKYHLLAPLLLNELQRQARAVVALEETVSELRALLEDLSRPAGSGDAVTGALPPVLPGGDR